MSQDESPLDGIEQYLVAHLTALDNSMNVLVRSLYRDGKIDRSTVEMVDTAYQKPLDVGASDNALIANLRRMHDDWFAALLADK